MPSIKSLVIVFEVESASKSHIEAIFARCFYNKDREVYTWFQVIGLGHYR